MSDRVSVRRLATLKARREPIVCVTAYDVLSATLADAAGVDVILVGDSLGNVILGHPTTLPVSLEDMVRHTEAVARSASRAMVVADLPFGTYQISLERAMEAAVALMKAGAQAVKLEGDYPDRIAAMVQAGIPVMGHLGFTPQSVHALGGFRVQGRGEDADTVAAAASSIQQAGVFAMVLELIPTELAQRITAQCAVPTIGIGASAQCDGQIQVFHDILGLAETTFKHAKRFVDGRRVLSRGLKAYVKEVRDGSFPSEDQSFH